MNVYFFEHLLVVTFTGVLFNYKLDTDCLLYFIGKRHGFHNRLCVCIVNIGATFTSKLFEMLKIVLPGLVLDSGSE